jgi:small subunit ribosomal protein S2
MVKLPSLLEMLQAGVHFGHQKSRWHPKMKPYLFGSRNNLYIIDLEKTVEELAKTLEYVKNISREGKTILFVGTKRQTQDLVKAAAINCNMPYAVERWIGGLITNFSELKKRLKKYDEMKKELKSGEVEKYTKKEQIDFKKDLEKMDKYLAGLVGLEKVPDALYIADMRTEKTALAEAQKKKMPVIAVCDSNVNPEEADYIIPANDDAVNSIKMMADLIAEAVNEGKAEAQKAANKIEK